MRINDQNRKQWVMVDVAGGGKIRVRAEGQQFRAKRDRALSNYAAANNIDRKDIPGDVDTDLYLRASIGESFGGFEGFEAEDGTPLAGGADPSNLDEDVCLLVLGIDEVLDAWVTARNRLNRERSKRWEGAEGN